MPKPTLKVLIIATVVIGLLPVRASASEKASISATFIPNRLGVNTTVVTEFKIAAAAGAIPPPLTEANVSLPAGMGLATSTLGLETCDDATLEAEGPSGCPPNSVMGVGTAYGEVPFGPVIVGETATVEAFMAKSKHGRTTIAFYADSETPIYSQGIFEGEVREGSAPYGLSLHTVIPLTPTLPGAPDVAVVEMQTSVGPLHVRYRRYVNGHRASYSPKGMMEPRHCPRGGFPVAAQFRFEDGSSARAHTVVPCPPKPTPINGA